MSGLWFGKVYDHVIDPTEMTDWLEHEGRYIFRPADAYILNM